MSGLSLVRRRWQDGHMPIQIAQEPRADEVLNADPFALVVGMMLDQQYPMDNPFS